MKKNQNKEMQEKDIIRTLLMGSALGEAEKLDVVVNDSVCVIHKGEMTVLELTSLIDTLSNIGALRMNSTHNTTGLAIKTVLRIVVADGVNSTTHNVVNFNVSIRANFSAHNNKAGRNEGLASAANLAQIAFALFFEFSFTSQNGVKNRV